MRHRTQFHPTFALLSLACVALADGVSIPSLPRLDVPHAAAAPTIDGDTSDPAWTQAATLPALLPAAKASGRALELQPTTVRVLWDAALLYVAFDCTDDEVFSTGTLRHDDDLYKEDVCEVFLDGFGDGRQYVEVQVSPTGENLDLMYLLTAEAEQGPDGRLSPEVMKTDRWGFREWTLEGLRTAARRTDRGWSAEFAIPAGPVMKRQGSPAFQPTEIRAQFMRYDWIPVEGKADRLLLQQNWSPVLHGNPHNTPAAMGRLILTPEP